jgi:PAS domain S-box-containing protein
VNSFKAFGRALEQDSRAAGSADFTVPVRMPMQLLDIAMARRVLEAAPAVIHVYDLRRGASVFQNRRFGELLGHAPQDDSGEWTVHIHPDDAQTLPEHRERLRTIGAGETLSFEFRMRDVSGGWRWFLSRDTLLAEGEDGKPHLIVGSASEITEQKQAEEHKELLAEEMRHRARNFTAVVQAIARMSRPKGQPEANKYIDVFMGRLMTLLNTGGIVLSSTARMADLRAVLDATLASFGADNIRSRVSITGPEVLLSEHTAAGMALAFHELTTNAIKYGALSTEMGRISISWSLTEGAQDRMFEMLWLETGGPPVKPPTSEGFGGAVIRQSVARERGAKTMLDYLPEGLSCRFEFIKVG